MRLLVSPFIALALLWAALQPAQAAASPPMMSSLLSAQADMPTAKKPKKAKKARAAAKGGGVVFYEGSGETRKERDTRLRRECRGRPNSGLCEGYARP